jgi:REP element-mobilizing transposase RayT
MTNHLHAIASTAGEQVLSDVVRDLKRLTSRRIQRQLQEDGNLALLDFFARTSLKRDGNTEGKIWQDGFHPVHLGEHDRFLQRIEYVENNPVRKGYVQLPEYWRYSSARNRVLGDHSVLEIDELERREVSPNLDAVQLLATSVFDSATVEQVGSPYRS